jgi:hypothetical protein
MTDPSNPIDSARSDESSHSKWSPIRWAIIASIAFHVVLVAVLLAFYFPRTSPTQNRETPEKSVAIATSDVLASEDPDSDPGGQQTSGAGQSETRTLPPADNIPPEQIESSLRSAIESTASIGEERKLSELRQNVQRLEQIASESSIADVGQAIRSATALEDRATVPAAQSIGGDFDFDSAQFHDVSREMDEDGKWVYRSILLDAKGRTVEVELTESEGKTAYETMQMVKASPFAEAIYRSMVMPMLDKLIPKTDPRSQSPAAPTPNQSAEAEDKP